jgi:flavin reductase (DIM6/NTAB) family NADH-FMN oxidoreductase RutF
VGDSWYYILHPRPAYIIVAESNGKTNFMAASWVMPLSEEPPRIVAALDKESYTTRLVIDSGVFSVNVYTINERDFVYSAGTVSGKNIDKPAVLGVKISKNPATGIPRIERPRPIGVIESRVYKIYSDVAEDVYLVVGDVVAAYADERLFNERFGWDLRNTKILLHAAGRGFTTNSSVYVARKLV